MEAEESPGQSSSLQSFHNTVLYDDESCEAIDSGGSSTRSNVGLAMKDQPYCYPKLPLQFIRRMRAVELVGSKCYRTPRGFQKEATFPCQSLLAHTSSSSSEGSSEPLFVSFLLGM